MGLHDDLRSFFTERVPDDWFTEPLAVDCDRDEVLVTGRLPVDQAVGPFRETTRDQRIRIAEAAESRWSRKVTWAVRVGDETIRFTAASVPVMTRLRLGERQVLDTLIAGGIARSRSEALAWCVRYVASEEADWLGELRSAAESMTAIRDRGPDAGRL